MEIRYKNKPCNWKREIRRIFTLLLGGILFASATFAVLFVFRKPLKKMLNIDEDNRIVFQVAGQEDGTETQGQNDGEEQVGEESSMVVYDYYEAGRKANNFLVGINEVSSEGYGGKKSYEEYACGIIVSKTKNMLVIMTSPNAVRGSNVAQVSFFNGQTVRAKVSATDSESGISILQVEKKLLDKDTKRDVTVATLGKSFAQTRGGYVAAIGNPLKDSRSIVVGQYTSVGGKTRMTDREYTLLETNILGQRNTVGFLLDENAAVVGVITHREDIEGENYTIKAFGMSDLSGLTDALCNKKKRPFMGVQVSTVSDETARAYGIPKGAYVEYVFLHSPAVEAGIQRGDILVAIGKREIKSTKYFTETLDQLSSGTTVKVQFMRFTNGNYKRMSADVVIGEQ